MAELTDKQKRFCDEFMIDLNGTRAYKKVYKVTNEKTASVNAARLLANAKVQAYLSKRKEKLALKLEITQEMVLEGYRKLAFYDARKFYDETGSLKEIIDLDDETSFALAGFEVAEEKALVRGKIKVSLCTKKIKMSDRKGALDSLCKVLGFNAPDKVAQTDKEGNDVIPKAPMSDDQFSQLLTAINGKV